MSRYQIQSWTPSAYCTCSPPRYPDHLNGCPYPTATRSWVPMEEGSARSKWLPKRTGIEAASQAHEWTGGSGIPAMQVVDLQTGKVVWRHADRYPGAGENIHPEWHRQVDAVARRLTAPQERKIEKAVEEKAAAVQWDPEQGSLF